MRRSLLLVSVLLAPALLSACGEDQGPRTPVAIVLTPNAPRVPAGGTRQLTATVVDDEPMAFESSEPAVVTVNEAGLLTSVGPLGRATITAASGDLSAEVEAEVVPPPSSLFVSPTSLRLVVGEFVQLYIIVTDENGDSIPNPGLTVHIDDAAVAAVSVEGWVEGKQSGLTLVTITSGEHRREVSVAVTP
jgi:uncharacterized protein YjdB